MPTGDIITFPASTGTLTGSITLSDGRPAAGASVSLNIEHLGQRASLSLGRASTVTSAQGEFELKNVAEGAYRLLTSLNFQRGYLDIILRPGDNTVRVSLHRPLSIAGRLNLESPEGSCATPEVVISRIDASSSEDRLPRTTAVLADGTFRFDGVTGTQLVQLRCSGFSYGTVRRIELNGQPIAGDVLEAAKLSGQVAMMLAANAPRNGISGEAVDRAGNRVPGLAVVAVDDPTKWRHPLKFMWTSRIRDGEFRLTGLPPGKYFVFHEPVRRVGELESPEYLRAVRSRGVSVVVRETGIVTVSLKTK